MYDNDKHDESKDWKAPGSKEAIEAGCTCPVMDNEYGRGVFLDGKLYYINKQCPIHGTKG